MNIPERIDAYRIFPRLTLLLFIIANAVTLNWYLAYEIEYVIKCDSKVIEVVLEKGGTLEQARDLACSPVDVIGRPSGYTALLSTLIGAAAVVFGFYANSGRKWNDNS